MRDSKPGMDLKQGYVGLWAEFRTMLGPVAVGCHWQPTSTWVLDVCVGGGGEPQSVETLACKAHSIPPFCLQPLFLQDSFQIN